MKKVITQVNKPTFDKLISFCEAKFPGFTKELIHKEEEMNSILDEVLNKTEQKNENHS